MTEDRVTRLEEKVDELKDLIHTKHEDTVNQIAGLFRNGPITRLETQIVAMQTTMDSMRETIDVYEKALEIHTIECPVRAEMEGYVKFRRKWWPAALVGIGLLLGIAIVGNLIPVATLQVLLPW